MERVNKLKIKPKGTYILGICDCGFRRRFELVKDFNILYEEEVKSYPLNETFCCPNCFKKYDYIKALQQGNKMVEYVTYGMIFFILCVIIGYKW